MGIIRTTFFYTGYYVVTILMAIVFIATFPLLSLKARHLFATTWCDFIIGSLKWFCGVRYSLSGVENIPPAPTIIVSNHQSSWETIFFYKLTFPISPILKKELLRIPFWGWAMRLQKPIAIDRSNPKVAAKSLLQQGVERLNQGCSIIVFPEGTRNPARTMKRFSRSAAKLSIASGIPIVPIAHNAGDCWPRSGYVKFPGEISVTVGPAISPIGKSAGELTEEAEGWIRSTLSEQGLLKAEG